MKLLQHKDGVESPTNTYPFGKTKNNSGTNDGFPLTSETLEDYHQFFAKMFDASGIAASGLPDNAINGFQLFDAFRKLTRTDKQYFANITQSGTSNPVVNILGVNEIGNIVWTRNSVGSYKGTLSGAFTNGKTWCGITLSSFGSPAAGIVQFARLTNDVIGINTFTADGVISDGILGNIQGCSLEIKVFS